MPSDYRVIGEKRRSVCSPEKNVRVSYAKHQSTMIFAIRALLLHTVLHPIYHPTMHSYLSMSMWKKIKTNGILGYVLLKQIELKISLFTLLSTKMTIKYLNINFSVIHIWVCTRSSSLYKREWFAICILFVQKIWFIN